MLYHIEMRLRKANEKLEKKLQKNNKHTLIVNKHFCQQFNTHTKTQLILVHTLTQLAKKKSIFCPL